VTQLTAGGTEQHLLVTGLRGVGKTVLLNEFERLALDAGWPAKKGGGMQILDREPAGVPATSVGA
jgi:hypothetical protein